MKKLSEVREAKKKARMDEQERHRTRCRNLLASLEGRNIPAFTDPSRPDSDFDVVRRRMRHQLREEIEEDRYKVAIVPIGVLCDHCETELVNHQPGRQTLGSPPKKHIGCPGCGWLGYIEA